MSAESVIVKERGFVVDFVGWIFSDMLQYILFTPFDVFKNSYTISILLKMSIVSASLVTALTMFEGLKRSLSMKYTPMSQILYKYPLALTVSALAPHGFYWMARGVNKLVELMGLITSSSMKGTDIFANTLQGLGTHIFMSVMSFFFLLVLMFYLFKILLFHAYRWFSLLFNMVVTPLVMIAYMFKPFENVAGAWFKDTMQKFFVQVGHSFLLGMIGIILYTPMMYPAEGFKDGIQLGLVRLMFAIGGLHMMLHPPKWFHALTDKGENSLGVLTRLTSFATRILLRK